MENDRDDKNGVIAYPHQSGIFKINKVEKINGIRTIDTMNDISIYIPLRPKIFYQTDKNETENTNSNNRTLEEFFDRTAYDKKHDLFRHLLLEFSARSERTDKERTQTTIYSKEHIHNKEFEIGNSLYFVDEKRSLFENFCVWIKCKCPIIGKRYISRNTKAKGTKI